MSLFHLQQILKLDNQDFERSEKECLQDIGIAKTKGKQTKRIKIFDR